MQTLEYKLKGKDVQFSSIDDAIRTTQFIRNKCLRFWMDNPTVRLSELNKYCAVLAKEYPFATKLNSQARQAAAERTAHAISRHVKPDTKGNRSNPPRFQKDCRSVEYKTTGWKLSPDRRSITFTDGYNIGILKMLGTQDLCAYSADLIKRVRLLRRVDGYYIQFCLDTERIEEQEPSGNTVGLDVGLSAFYTDSNGEKVKCPRFLRKAEKRLKFLQRMVTRKQKGSSNRSKAKNRLARKHLQIQRQRKDFVVKAARCVVISNDVIALEDLQIRNMLKNHCLAKSINDAAWFQFRMWLEYYGKVYGKIVVFVPPQFTSADCSRCGNRVKKSLSERTHCCLCCGCVLDRDENAARNILILGLQLVLKLYPGAQGNSETSVSQTLVERRTSATQYAVSASHLVEARSPRF